MIHKKQKPTGSSHPIPGRQPNLPPDPPPCAPRIPTTFPKVIKFKELKPFNETPPDLESFEIGINF